MQSNLHRATCTEHLAWCCLALASRMLRVGKKNASCSVGPTSLAMFCFRANRRLVDMLARPSAEIGVVEVQNSSFFLCFLICPRDPLRRSAWSRCKNSRFCFSFFLPCGALGQLAQSSLHRVTSMEVSGALGQLAQSSLHRVTSMEMPAWRYLRRVTSAELPAWRYLRRVTMGIPAWRYLRRVTSMEILAQSHQHGVTSIELLAQSQVQRAKRIEPSAQSEVQRARCKEPSAQS